MTSCCAGAATTPRCGGCSRAASSAPPLSRRRNRRQPFPPRRTRPIFGAMAKPPDKSKKPKDPARPTRAKASRPDAPATPDSLADLLNPGINKGTAGLGSGTGGLQPPPDNSFDRRADFSAAHKARKSARKSTPKPAEGFSEAPQSDYTGSPISGLDPRLAKELGLGGEEEAATLPSPASGGGKEKMQGEVKKADPKYR